MGEFYGVHLSGLGHHSDATASSWPGGEYWFRHEDLAGLLLSAARDNAVRALTLYISSDRLELLQAAVAVGAAVELAAKAFLASIEPNLLAERADVDTILHLSGKRSLAAEPATAIRTLGGVAACRLARRLGREVVAGETEVVRAMEVRNSATHMALVDREELRSRVPAMVRIVDSLVVEMGEDRARFWANRLELADQLIEERLQQVAQIVEAKRAAATERLAQLTRHLNEASRVLVLASLARHAVSSDHDEAVNCPVCGQKAWLCCWVEDGGSDVEDGEVWFHQTAWPFEFNCSVCGLTLEGDEELSAMQLDAGIELEPRPQDESDYEPPDRLEEV
jgi:hypothetical protein